MLLTSFALEYWGVKGESPLNGFSEFLFDILMVKESFESRFVYFNAFYKFNWNWGLDFSTSYIKWTC